MRQFNLTPEAYERFAQKVYEIVATIPEGKVATYGQIAAMAGEPDAAQEAGYAMSRVTPAQNLPCHRVVNKAGTLSPDFAFGGQDRQRSLLEAEGITFTVKGRIDMGRHTWGEDEQLSLL